MDVQLRCLLDDDLIAVGDGLVVDLAFEALAYRDGGRDLVVDAAKEEYRTSCADDGGGCQHRQKCCGVHILTFGEITYGTINNC